MPPDYAEPDVRSLRNQKFPELEFPGGRGQPYRVYFAPEVHQEIWKHASEDTGVEICGVLVGALARDAAGPFLQVSASIRGQKAANKFAEVTFTHETWSVINAEMDSKYADRRIVGWYHTHPNFGIFLSDRDRFIQENFFSGPEQIALVVDPIQRCEGVFIWQDKATVLIDHYWVDNQVIPKPASASREPAQASAPTSAASSAIAPFERSLPFLSRALTYLLVFLVGFLLAGTLQRRSTERARDEAVAKAFYTLGLRPGLEEHLQAASSELSAAQTVARNLAKSHQSAVGESEEAEAASRDWLSLGQRLNKASEVLAVAEQRYAMTPEEQRALKRLHESIARRAKRSAAPAGASTQESSPAGASTRESSPAGASTRENSPSGASTQEEAPAGQNTTVASE